MPADQVVPASRVASPPLPLSAADVEWRRLTRTSRLISLFVVFVLLGLIEPLFTRYADVIMDRLGSGTTGRIILPAPTVELALTAYLGQAVQLGGLVVAGMVVAACALDSCYALGVYYRTRVRSVRRLVLVRWAVTLAAALAAYAVGLVCAVLQTGLVIGWADARAWAGAWLAGTAALALSGALGLGAVAVVPRPLPAFGVAAALVMVGVPLVSALPAVAAWAPGALADPAHALAGPWPPLLRPAIVTLALSAVIAAAASSRLAAARPRRDA